MQVVIRMQDVDVLAEIVDEIEDGWGYKPAEESTEGEWCAAIYHAGAGIVTERLISAVVRMANEYGLCDEDCDKPFEIRIGRSR